MAATFLDKPGVPNVSAHLTCEQGARWNVELRQEPWRPLGTQADLNSQQTWIIPACVRAEGRDNPFCADLSQAGAPGLVAGTGRCPAWIHPNAAEGAYYRFTMSETEMATLARAATALDVPSRIGIIANLWAQVRAGNVSPAYALATLPLFDGEKNRFVVDQILGALYSMNDALVEDAARPTFRKYAQARLDGRKKFFGWTPKKNEDEETGMVRRSVLYALAEIAEDDKTLAEAEPFAATWLKDPASVDEDTAQLALELAARTASPERLEQLRGIAKTAKTPEDRILALRALGSVNDKAQLARALDFTLTDDVKIQDVRYVFGAALSRRTSRPVVVDWVKSHWDALRAKLPGPLAVRLMNVAGAVCTREERDQVDAFYTPRAKEIDGAERPLAEALETASLCVELRARGANDVTKYFQKQKK
jgi:alanyl aminopeptidase